MLLDYVLLVEPFPALNMFLDAGGLQEGVATVITEDQELDDVVYATSVDTIDSSSPPACVTPVTRINKALNRGVERPYLLAIACLCTPSFDLSASLEPCTMAIISLANLSSSV